MNEIVRYSALILGIYCFYGAGVGIIGLILCLFNKIGIGQFKYFIPIIGIKYLLKDSKEYKEI